MTVQKEIAEFFADYVAAFTRRDADALSELWDALALLPSPTGNFVMERQAFRDHCARLMDFYRQQGVVSVDGALLGAIELFPGVAQARLSYRLRDQDDEIIAEWEHVYILRRIDRWRISLTIADAEVAAWAAKGVQLWNPSSTNGASG